MSIAPVSQFFILSPRGDTIISKDYRGDGVAGTTDIFFRKVGSVQAPPSSALNNFLRVPYLFIGVISMLGCPTQGGLSDPNFQVSKYSSNM